MVQAAEVPAVGPSGNGATAGEAGVRTRRCASEDGFEHGSEDGCGEGFEDGWPLHLEGNGNIHIATDLEER